MINFQRQLNLVKRRLGKAKTNLKYTFKVKRNQRRAIYAGLGVVCLTLLVGLIYSINTTVQANDVLYQRHIKLERLTQDLQDVQKLQTTTKTQLKAKKASEASLKARINKLKRQLEAKRKASIASRVVNTVTLTQTAYAVPANSTGNTYTYGYCTAWVKDRLSWVRNGWGDAAMWGYNAPIDGFSVHSYPIVGAIAWSAGNHVAVVERVSGAEVYVSEKNFQGWNVLSYRWTSTSNWSGFIY